MGCNINKIIDSKTTALLVFGVTGAGKVISDYKNAPDDRKDFVLTRDSLILGGTALGVAAYSGGRKLLLNKCKNADFTNIANNSSLMKSGMNVLKKIPNSIKTACKNSAMVIGDCLDNTLMLGCGILGAVAADYGIQFSHIEKNKRLRKLNRAGDSTFNAIYNYENKIKGNFKNSKFNQDLENNLSSEFRTNLYSRVTDLPAMRMFGTTMVGMQGFEVIEEKTFKKRMKHATGCLISNSVIPLFFLSTSSRITKNMKDIFRAPVIFTALVGGTMYANKLINNLDKGKGLLYKLMHKEPKPVAADEKVIG